MHDIVKKSFNMKKKKSETESEYLRNNLGDGNGWWNSGSFPYEDPTYDSQQCKNLPVSKQTPSIQVLRIFYISLL